MRIPCPSARLATFALLILFQFSPSSSAQDADFERRVNQTVREMGVVESAREVEFRSPIEATIMFALEEGAQVEAGDVLIKLDSASLDDERSKQEVAVAKAKAGLVVAAAMKQNAAEETASGAATAEMAVKVAELALRGFIAEDGELACRVNELQNEIDLGNEKIKSLESIAAAEAAKTKSGSGGSVGAAAASFALREAKAKIEVAERSKKWLQEHVRAYQSAELKLALMKAEHEYRLAKNSLQLNLDNAEAAMSTAETVHSVELEKLKALERKVKACEVRAPVAGLVLYPVPSSSRGSRSATIEVGAVVRPQQTILRLVDMNRLQLRVSVHETRIGQIRKGQAVAIRFDALPDTIVKGTVTLINATPEPVSWLQGDIKKYSVVVAIEESQQKLRLGMTAMAEIDVAK